MLQPLWTYESLISSSPKAGETKFSMETNWLSARGDKQNSRSRKLWDTMNFHRTLHWGLILLVIPECNQDCIVIESCILFLVFTNTFPKQVSIFKISTGCRFLLSHCPQRTAAACIFALSSGSLSCRRDWKGLSVHRRTPSHGVYVFFFLFLEQSALSTSLKSQTIEHTKFLNGYLVYVLTNDIIRQIIHCHMSRNMSCQVLLELGGVARVDQTFGKCYHSWHMDPGLF